MPNRPNSAVPFTVRRSGRVVVVIPAVDEAEAIGRVLADIPPGIVDEVVVVDNGSTDRTGDIARSLGATVIREERRGYGQACLAGIDHARKGAAVVLVFMDGDHADHPEEMERLIEPVRSGTADLVIGSRMLGNREQGSMPPQAVYGNWLASALLRLIWGVRFTDLGPFRVIGMDALERLGMTDRNFGWTIEMQIRAGEAGLRCLEIPVSYRRRIGRSKVSGTLRGTVLASAKILWTIARYAITRGRRAYPDETAPAGRPD